MKKLCFLLLAVVLLLSACSTSKGENFPITVHEATAQLQEKAEALSVNAFKSKPIDLDVKDGCGYSYNLGGGIRIALYGDKNDMLTSVYLSTTTEEFNANSKTLQEEYSGLLIEHFVPADELESVKNQLGGQTKVNKVATSSVTCSTAVITMEGNGATTYLIIEPAK